MTYFTKIHFMMKFSWAISLVKWSSGEKNHHFEDHLCLVMTSTPRTRTKMVFETVFFLPLNHLTQLIAQENFIILSCWESNKSHKTHFNIMLSPITRSLKHPFLIRFSNQNSVCTPHFSHAYCTHAIPVDLISLSILYEGYILQSPLCHQTQ
jgi:hypothetical protein